MSIPAIISEKMNRKLHLQPDNPICLVKDKIIKLFKDFEHFYFDDPVVSVEQNFDQLLIPKDHPSRSHGDTYYVDENKVLRTHTSAHQCTLLESGKKKFIVTGDVYRRDEIDRCHYPVFHQMEGVSLSQGNVLFELKWTMRALVHGLFGEIEYRFVDSYFPFTNPSYELEILWKGEWIEVAGMGIIHPDILKSCGIAGEGWAFGLGLERLAMILCEIPDIRLFWTEDKRFANQFKNGLTKFIPYSKYPPCYKDVSLWALNPSYNHNDFYELVREIGGDLIESVKLTDTFSKPGKGVSYCYRINYQSLDRVLENEEINLIQERVRQATKKLLVELR